MYNVIISKQMTFLEFHDGSDSNTTAAYTHRAKCLLQSLTAITINIFI